MLFLKLLKDLLYSTNYNIFNHIVKWIQLKSSVRLGSELLYTLTHLTGGGEQPYTLTHLSGGSEQPYTLTHLTGGSEQAYTLTHLTGPEYFFLKLWLTLDISNIISVTVISILIIITYFSYIY